MNTKINLTVNQDNKIIGVWKGKQMYAKRHTWTSNANLKKLGMKLKSLKFLGEKWYLPVKR